MGWVCAQDDVDTGIVRVKDGRLWFDYAVLPDPPPPRVILNHWSTVIEVCWREGDSQYRSGLTCPLRRLCSNSLNLPSTCELWPFLMSFLLSRKTSYLCAPLPSECLPILKALMSGPSSEPPPPGQLSLLLFSPHHSSLWKLTNRSIMLFLTNDTTLSI